MYIFYFLSLNLNRIVVDLRNSHVLLENKLRDTLYISKIRIK